MTDLIELAEGDCAYIIRANGDQLVMIPEMEDDVPIQPGEPAWWMAAFSIFVDEPLAENARDTVAALMAMEDQGGRDGEDNKGS